jgi:uncharacterized membrane protein
MRNSWTRLSGAVFTLGGLAFVLSAILTTDPISVHRLITGIVMLTLGIFYLLIFGQPKNRKGLK